MPPLQYLFVGERITQNVDPDMVIDDKIRSKKIRERLQKKLMRKKLGEYVSIGAKQYAYKLSDGGYIYSSYSITPQKLVKASLK